MGRASEYLVEIIGVPYGEAEITLRVATAGYVTKPDDDPADTFYAGVVADPGTFSRALFADGRTRGESQIELGEISMVNTDGGLDDWWTYDLAGHEVRVYRIASVAAAFSTAVLVLKATVESVDTNEALSGLNIRLRGRRLDLDRPLQTILYAGTTNSGGATAEGTTDLKDQPKPLLYGTANNVPAVTVNAFDLIYQVNDGAVSSIAVYDGGVPLTLGSNKANLSSLQSGSVALGGYNTCTSLGLFKLGSSPAGQITADVVEGATAADRRPGAIAQRILSRAGITGSENVDSDSFDDLDTAAPYDCGIFIKDDKSALTAVREVVQSVGGWVSPNALGVFEAGQMAAPGTPVGEITVNDILTDDIDLGINPDDDGIPPWRISLKHGRNWQVMEGAQVYGCVSQSRRGYLGQQWREARVEDGDIKVAFPLSAELGIETLLSDSDDAGDEADRLLALYGVSRDVLVDVVVDKDSATDFLPGATVTVTLARLGYGSGRDMVVIGRDERFADDAVALTLWG